MRVESHAEARPPNWLPLPGEELAAGEPPPVVNEDDLFPKGEVLSFYPQQGYGYVKNDRGQELVFRLTEIALVGPKDERYLAPGCRVGYDVSWTSHGLHVSRLKIY
jgi:cold shock CspA family protein